ncbi:MAG: cytochrome c [Hyphomicrobiaceae bacterium]|nr:cytochrome c [Hyphomicrobiaceae bacterium]
MKNLCKSVIAAGALAVVATGSFADEPAKERQELMKTVKKAVQVLVPMAKGEAPYDAKAAVDAMKAINGVPDPFVALFPKGSETGHDTEASPKIWENPAGFKAKAEEMKTASAEGIKQAGEGVDALKAVLFGQVLKTCKSCHDEYRVKKN